MKIDWRIYTKDKLKPLIGFNSEGLSLAKPKRRVCLNSNSNNNNVDILIQKLEFSKIKLNGGPPGLEPGTNTL